MPFYKFHISCLLVKQSSILYRGSQSRRAYCSSLDIRLGHRTSGGRGSSPCDVEGLSAAGLVAGHAGTVGGLGLVATVLTDIAGLNAHTNTSFALHTYIAETWTISP